MSELGTKLIATVRRLAEENPNFVYVAPTTNGSCVYVKDGKPSCLIGQALWEHGLITASLEDDPTTIPGSSTAPPAPVNVVKANLLIEWLGLPLDEDEIAWLNRVQGYQDSQLTWGAAVAAA